MKLLLILCIEEYGDDVRKILSSQGVPIYSETDIHGFKTDTNKPDLSNWFAQKAGGTFSKLFFSIQPESSVKSVLDAIEEFNKASEDHSRYPIHAYQLAIENQV